MLEGERIAAKELFSAAVPDFSQTVCLLLAGTPEEQDVAYETLTGAEPMFAVSAGLGHRHRYW